MEVSARGPSRLLRVKAATASSLGATGAPPWWSDEFWRLCGRLAWEPALDSLQRELTCLKFCIHGLSRLITGNVPVESEGFWWWCITLRITGFLVFVRRPIVWNSKYMKTQRFRNWTCFLPQVRGGRHLTLALSKGSNRIGFSLPHLRTETGSVFEMLFSCI
jgi:hypothetical protein